MAFQPLAVEWFLAEQRQNECDYQRLRSMQFDSAANSESRKMYLVEFNDIITHSEAHLT